MDKPLIMCRVVEGHDTRNRLARHVADWIFTKAFSGKGSAGSGMMNREGLRFERLRGKVGDNEYLLSSVSILNRQRGTTILTQERVYKRMNTKVYSKGY